MHHVAVGRPGSKRDNGGQWEIDLISRLADIVNPKARIHGLNDAPPEEGEVLGFNCGQ